MNIHLKTIPHKSQRYPTVGDYFEENKSLQFRVSEMRNEDYEFLVAIHEMVEHHLIKKNGLSIEEIDEFDKMFERERVRGLHSPEDEPGHDSRSPYRKEHIFAEYIEHEIAEKIGVDWYQYGRAVSSL